MQHRSVENSIPKIIKNSTTKQVKINKQINNKVVYYMNWISDYVILKGIKTCNVMIFQSPQN